MQLTVERIQGRGALAVVGVRGKMDGPNFLELVGQARDLHDRGVEQILLDWSGTSFLSTSGLVAIHSIALLMEVNPPKDPEQGWAAFRAVADAADSERQHRVRLLKPQASVQRTLTRAGLDQFFEIHTDLEAALSSF